MPNTFFLFFGIFRGIWLPKIGGNHYTSKQLSDYYYIYCDRRKKKKKTPLRKFNANIFSYYWQCLSRKIPSTRFIDKIIPLSRKIKGYRFSLIIS